MDIGRQAQQVHDLRDARRGELGQFGKFGLDARAVPYAGAGPEARSSRRRRGQSSREALEKYSMYEVLKPAIDRFKNDKKLSDVTIALDKALISRSEKFAHFYPLSVLPIVNYMIRTKVEVDNIRIIARGKESRLPGKTIEELLVV